MCASHSDRRLLPRRGAWGEGGYPRLSLNHQASLDLTLVASEHLRQWMVDGGADPERVRVCTINVDTRRLRPDRA